jgi:hypothetical protein
MSTELVAAAEVAAAAVTVLTPYLNEAGKEAAKAVGKEAASQGGKLLGWLRDRLTGRGAEALAELERAPTDADNQADLRKQLKALLTDDPALLDALRDLLAESAPGGDALSQTVTGDNNKVAQVAGSGNSVSVA